MSESDIYRFLTILIANALLFVILFLTQNMINKNGFELENSELSLIGMAVNDITIKQGDRIATLEMQPKQNATVWQKLQWLFTKWKVKVVDDINER